MRSKPAIAYTVLFFLSGATGLIYELLWVRVLYQSFGSTIQSVTTVVAAYMGGLGLGAWLFGRIADRSPRPAVLYGWLELAIGAFGVISPLVLGLAHWLYIGAAGALALQGGASVALRFGLAALVLLIPTTLMGGTLPVLTRALMGDDRDLLKPSLGRLYGLNTLGAVTGTALAGFFLVEFVGVRASLWATAALNLAIGVAAIRLGREPGISDSGRQRGVQELGTVTSDHLRTLALMLLGFTAFASLLDEIAWTRVLVMIVGGSTYAFTLILLVFLLGIGLGSVIVARRSLPRDETAAAAAVAQGITGTGAALLFLFFGFLPTYIIAVFQIPDLSAASRLLLMGVAVGAVVLVPAIGMGMTFPLLTDLTARPRDARGADVGAAYALNTVGSILGAVLTGFVLVVVVGTQTTLRLGLVVNGLAALVLAGFAARGIAEGSQDHRRLRVRVMSAGILGTLAVVAAFGGPGWSTRLIDLGPTIYARQRMDTPARRQFLAHRGVRQLTFREGPNATVSVWEGEAGRTLRVNGKVDASDRGDMDTQIMLGLAPVVARPGAASSLLIGYGTGVTAHVLASVPAMARVKVVEIEPAVMGTDSLFRGVNQSVLFRPNVRVVIDDARSALQLDRDRYDIIVSEPSNPWIAGIATLYTPEFFRIAKAKLSDDGVFCQWIQLYQLPLPIVAGIVRSLRQVFPHVNVWFGGTADLLVLGSSRPLTYDQKWLGALIGPGGRLHSLVHEWLSIDSPDQYFGRLLLGDSGASRLVERARFDHTDNRPRLEFVAARRFLDPMSAVYAVFDSVVRIGNHEDGTSSLALIHILAARRSDAELLPYLDAARGAQPDVAEWTARTAEVRLAMGDTATADSLLDLAIARGANPDALLSRALLAAARNKPLAGVALREALAAGADTAQVRAALSLVAVRSSRWRDAAIQARGALAAAQGTFRHPFPGEFLAQALSQIALDAPAPLADSLLSYAVTRRPGSARLRELSAVAALRAGRCDDAAASFVELLDFAYVRENGPALVRECWAEQRATPTGSGTPGAGGTRGAGATRGAPGTGAAARRMEEKR
ncbi:MAG TPA: fused MFS/spermidine synthase [Gemmatimonadales bacterium]|nr:fused MFS/spermidine synthase [Gemmatimonadales bacterium]